MDKYPVFNECSFDRQPLLMKPRPIGDSTQLNKKFLKDHFGVDVDELAKRGRQVQFVEIHGSIMAIEGPIDG